MLLLTIADRKTAVQPSLCLGRAALTSHNYSLNTASSQKEQQGKQWKASMCARILFLSFEELVIRQSHNIKETLGEKKNTDLYLVNKSKITEHLCHIYHHGIISFKEFLVVSRDKFRQWIWKVERFEKEKFLGFSWTSLGTCRPPFTLTIWFSNPPKATQDPSSATSMNCMCVACHPTYTRGSSRQREGLAPFLKGEQVRLLSCTPEPQHPAASASLPQYRLLAGKKKK